MPIRLGHFEKPDKLTKSDDSNDTYAKYAAEPFETGFGHTIGNSLRRVLLSSLEGAAITSVKIEGRPRVHHRAGVVEDVTDIVLNLKKIKFRHTSREPQEVRLSVTAEGVVTAGDWNCRRHSRSSTRSRSSARPTKRKRSRWYWRYRWPIPSR